MRLRCATIVHLLFLTLLVIGQHGVSLALRKDHGASISPKYGDYDQKGHGNPFHTLVEYILRSDRREKEFAKYSAKEVEKAIKKLAAGQKAMKQMDGASHMLNSALSDKKSSLTARFKKFDQLDLEQESKGMQKEASKVLEYVNVVERGMQASEILQALSETNEKRRKEYLEYANLKEIKRMTLSCDKVKVVLSALLPIERDSTGRLAAGEIIIGVVDNCNVENILRMCTKPTSTVALKSMGLLSEEITILPVILELSLQAAEALGDVLIPARVEVETMGESESGGMNIGKGKSRGKGKGKKRGSRKARSEAENVELTTVSSQTHSRSGLELPQKVRVLGHSAGGAVAAYLSMFLDGSLSLDGEESERVDPVVALYKDRVRCITLGSPPCISRNLVPRFISSLICGDDIVSRAHVESLAYMKKRVVGSLASSASFTGFIPGAAFLSDVASVTGKTMSSYTGNSHDLESVHVPGRVFFMKNRKHKNGVSFQRVLRGNWREDMIWMLRDIFLSTKMFEHHQIESYIKTLMRC